MKLTKSKLREIIREEIKESVNKVKKGSIVIPFAHDKDGEFIVNKVFKNKDGETSYTGKFKKSRKKKEFILHKKDKIVKESVKEGKLTEKKMTHITSPPYGKQQLLKLAWMLPDLGLKNKVDYKLSSNEKILAINTEKIGLNQKKYFKKKIGIDLDKIFKEGKLDEHNYTVGVEEYVSGFYVMVQTDSIAPNTFRAIKKSRSESKSKAESFAKKLVKKNKGEYSGFLGKNRARPEPMFYGGEKLEDLEKVLDDIIEQFHPDMMWVGKGAIVNEALKPKDKKVIQAFYDKKPLEGKMLNTDGKTLDKLGMGRDTVAMWKDNKIEITSKSAVRSDDMILRYMKKYIPKGNFSSKTPIDKFI